MRSSAAMYALVLTGCTGTLGTLGSSVLDGPSQARDIPPTGVAVADLCGSPVEADARAAIPSLPECGLGATFRYARVEAGGHDLLFVVAVPVGQPLHRHVVIDGEPLPDTVEADGEALSPIGALSTHADLNQVGEDQLASLLVGALLYQHATFWAGWNAVSTNPESDGALVDDGTEAADAVANAPSGYADRGVPRMRVWARVTDAGASDSDCGRLLGVEASLSRGRILIEGRQPMPACR